MQILNIILNTLFLLLGLLGSCYYVNRVAFLRQKMTLVKFMTVGSMPCVRAISHVHPLHSLRARTPSCWQGKGAEEEHTQ